MKTMLGLEPATFSPARLVATLSSAEQPANKAVAVATAVFKNCLLFILLSRMKVRVRHAPDTIAGVVAEVILLRHVILRQSCHTYSWD
jgi:hypothetical protein